jgi:hypothetical protein
LSLTESGLGVADGVRGKTFEHLPPAQGLEAAAPPLTEDGFNPRNSGRPDLYPGIPHHFRSGPQQPALGRLDEVTAPEPELAPEAPAGIQVPPAPLAARPAAAAPSAS